MRVFFIGVCGTAMGNAAVLLKKMGHDVAGSDAGVYPPMSDVLKDAGIDLFEGFEAEEMIGWGPDRVVVGNAVSGGILRLKVAIYTPDSICLSSPTDRGGPDWKPSIDRGGRYTWKNHHYGTDCLFSSSSRNESWIPGGRGAPGSSFRE